VESGNFGGCPAHGTKQWESAALCHSILNNGVTATADCSALSSSVSHYIVPGEKSASAMWPIRQTFFDYILVTTWPFS